MEGTGNVLANELQAVLLCEAPGWPKMERGRLAARAERTGPALVHAQKSTTSPDLGSESASQRE